MAAPQSTREQLLRLVDDIEIIAKELFENIIAPKNQRLSAAEHGQLAELLVAKDEELKQTLVIAAGQAEVQKTINSLQEEVEKQDHDIPLASMAAEGSGTLAVYGYIPGKAETTEHRKGKCPSTPHNWQQGDPRRPYPTDIEMRQGYLGRLSDLPLTGPTLQPQGSLGDLNAARHLDQNPLGQSFSWQIGGDIKPPISSNHNSVGMDAKSKENEDVEVMSTDSSSSSSSDSQ
ncbi:hypothetical protein MRX96_021630 [Rhipicephalus microplus]